MSNPVMIQFVDQLPEKESTLKIAFKDEDFSTYAKCLSELLEFLRKLELDDLAALCTKHLQEFRALPREQLEAQLSSLLGDLTAASIDIQMGGYEKEEEQVQEKTSAELQAHDGMRQKTILAVDDAAFFLRSLKTNLSGTGYKLVCLTSGREAIRYFQKERPDLCILDIEMPEISGYELARQIKRLDHRIPVIFLTGNAQKDYVMKAMEVGAVDFIIKPINREQVLKRIAKYI